MLNSHITTLFSFDTEYNADSVEWCPHIPNQNIFVCASYQLKENETLNENGFQKRFGRILSFSVTAGGLKVLQKINTAAVLDQKWCHIKINDCSILGVANALGRIEVYRLNENLQLELMCYYEVRTENVETLILSLDWSTGILKTNEPEIICSDSKGDIHLLSLENNVLKLLCIWHGHSFEAWIAGFYYWDTNLFFTGGDDSTFLKFDRRIGNDPVAKNSSHNAGVTSLHSCSSKENILVTGSYDEYIRLWDIRHMKNEISQIKMPGTLWRLKWDPFYQDHLIAACMLNGVHIVDVDSRHNLVLVASYNEHKNISYGADWCYLEEESCKEYNKDAIAIIATCSFYDHLLCVSAVNMSLVSL